WCFVPGPDVVVPGCLPGNVTAPGFRLRGGLPRTGCRGAGLCGAGLSAGRSRGRETTARLLGWLVVHIAHGRVSVRFRDSRRTGRREELWGMLPRTAPSGVIRGG